MMANHNVQAQLSLSWKVRVFIRTDAKLVIE